MPRKINFPPIPGTEDEQWDELAAEFGMKRDEIKKIVSPSWMFDKGFINKWDVRKMLFNKGYKQIIQPEEDDPEKTHNEWLEEHPFTKKWLDTCSGGVGISSPVYEKPKYAETINESEINIEDMDELNELKPNIIKTENKINLEEIIKFAEAVEKKRRVDKNTEEHGPFIARFIEDSREHEAEHIKENISRMMKNGMLSDEEEMAISEKIKSHKNGCEKEIITGKLTPQEEEVVKGWIDTVTPPQENESVNEDEKEDEGNSIVEIRENSFDDIAFRIMDLHRRKNKDYGNAAHESYKEFGLISYVIRLNDKLNRLKSLTRPGTTMEVKDESIIDTLKDLAAYSIMAVESLLNQ